MRIIGRRANESGHCWMPRYERIRPEFFRLADLRIAYLVARWGAWPVIWQLTMESDMAYYPSEDLEGDPVWQREAWREVGHYLRSLDPFGRLITMQRGACTGR